jgi:ABC-type nitrate/sulfonate/bicarbonate transport system permease component
MRNRSLLPLLTVLLLVPTAASAQLRFQPPPPSSRLDLRAQPSGEVPRVVPVADTLMRRPTYWKTGFWLGVATGVALGTLVVIDPPASDLRLTTSRRLYDGFLVASLVGIPLSVIGGLIGDAFKKPVSAGPLSP